MTRYRTKSLTLAVLFTASSLLGVATASAATAPEIQCNQAVAKTLSKCTKKAIGVHANCFKKTGAACLTGDASLAKALVSVQKSIFSKCPTIGIVADAGYGPYSVANFANFVADSCEWQAELMAGPHDDTIKELARLRRENELLRVERDLLKKATAFFAKETSR